MRIAFEKYEDIENAKNISRMNNKCVRKCFIQLYVNNFADDFYLLEVAECNGMKLRTGSQTI